MAKKNQPKRNKKQPVKKPVTPLSVVQDIHLAMTRRDVPFVSCACGFEHKADVLCNLCNVKAKAELPPNVTENADCSVPTTEKELKDMHKGWLVDNMTPKAEDGPFSQGSGLMRKITTGSLRDSPYEAAAIDKSSKEWRQFQASEDAVARDWLMAPANQVTPMYNEFSHQTLTAACRATSGYGNSDSEKLGDSLPIMVASDPSLIHKLSLEEKERRIKILESIIGDPAQSMLGLAAMYSADPVKNLGFVEALDWDGLKESLAEERKKLEENGGYMLATIPTHSQGLGFPPAGMRGFVMGTKGFVNPDGSMDNLSFNPINSGGDFDFAMMHGSNNGIVDCVASYHAETLKNINPDFEALPNGIQIKIKFDMRVKAHRAALIELNSHCGKNFEGTITLAEFVKDQIAARAVLKRKLLSGESIDLKVLELSMDKDDPSPVQTILFAVALEVGKTDDNLASIPMPDVFYLEDRTPNFHARWKKQLDGQITDKDVEEAGKIVTRANARQANAQSDFEGDKIEINLDAIPGYMRDIVSYDPVQDKFVVKKLISDDFVFSGWK